MEHKDSEILDSIIAPERKIRRRDLLPWWIKTFSWIFMIFGAVTIPVLVAGVLGGSFVLSFYGLETFDPLSAISIFISSTFLFKGYTAYCLWMEKDAAITLAQIDATLGIATCVYMMTVYPFYNEFGKFHFEIRLELLLLVPYLIKLGSIKKQWQS